MIFEKEELIQPRSLGTRLELIDLCSYYLTNLVTKLTLLTVQYVCSQRIPSTLNEFPYFNGS